MTVQADVHPVHIHEMMARLGIERDAVVSPRSGCGVKRRCTDVKLAQQKRNARCGLTTRQQR